MSAWFNTLDYTIPQLFWNGVGCFFWLIAYVELIRNSRKTQFVEMPFAIATGNVTWEFIWSFVVHPDTGKFYVHGYQISFLFDVCIVILLFKYGSKQTDLSELKKRFHWLLGALLLFWFALIYSFILAGYDTKIGANSGYLLNVLISVTCPVLYFRHKEKQVNFSALMAWSKFVGTGFITVSMFLIYPENYFVQVMGIICFLLDLYFIFLIKGFNLRRK